MKKATKIFMLAMFCGLISVANAGSISVYQFDNAEDETRYRALIEEFRCPKCQNQNLAGSDAPIAQDLKHQTYTMIKDGRSDGEIRNYMFERYGDFISYKPPMRPSTWILWIFPPILLAVLLGGWVFKTKRRKAVLSVEEARELSSLDEARLAKILASHQEESKDTDANSMDDPKEKS